MGAASTCATCRPARSTTTRPHPPAGAPPTATATARTRPTCWPSCCARPASRPGWRTLGARGDGQVIEPSRRPWGTHAIAVATIDGKDHWIDTTANLIGWDVLPRDDRDRECYVVDDKGLRRVRTPKATPADSLTEQTVTLKVATDGSPAANGS